MRELPQLSAEELPLDLFLVRVCAHACVFYWGVTSRVPYKQAHLTPLSSTPMPPLPLQMHTHCLNTQKAHKQEATVSSTCALCCHNSYLTEEEEEETTIYTSELYSIECFGKTWKDSVDLCSNSFIKLLKVFFCFNTWNRMSGNCTDHTQCVCQYVCVCMHSGYICMLHSVCVPLKLAGALETPAVFIRQAANTQLPILKTHISMKSEDLGTCSAPFLLKDETHCISRLSSSETASTTLARTRGTSSLEIVNTWWKV